MGAERWDERVGSVADEATRLLESLRRSAAEAAEAAEHSPGPDVGPDAAASGDAPSAPGDVAATGPEATAHDPFCTWCPLCRGAAVVRSLSPETLARLADLAGLAATVLTDLASSRSTGSTAAAGGDRGGASTERDEGTSRARRSGPAPSRPIPVTDADDPQEAPRG